MKYKFIEHTADIKFQAFGTTPEKVFENSSLALKEIISEDKTDSKLKKEIYSEGKDYEELLYNFLEEFLVLFDSEGFILSKAEKLEIKEDKKGYRLESVVLGDSLSDSGKDYEISNHVKAITYNEMSVKKEKEKWVSNVVVDV